MGSHALAAKYNRLSDDLKARLVGTDYNVPNFGTADPESLNGYRVALVTTHGPELPEFDVPVSYLRDRGAAVEIVTQDWLFDFQPEAPGMVVLAQWLAVNVCVHADKKISEAKIEDYDGVIIIGGAWNPIMLRADRDITRFVSNAQKQRKLIAAVCHGPQLLISCEAFPPGTRATGVRDVRIDLINAGFKLPDGDVNSEAYDSNHPVVYDESQRLITSPNPNALKEFCEEISRRLREVACVHL